MRKRVVFAGIGLGCCLAWAGVAWSQLRGTDWTTGGNDAQRSSWIRSDSKISVESVRQPAFQLAWKLKLNNEPRQLNALTAPVLFDFYIGYRGFRSLGFVGGSSDRVFAIDTDLARMEWEKSLSAGSASRDASLDCPGGLTANLSRPAAAGLPPPFGFGGPGRRNPARSGVGEPKQGAVTLAEAGRSNFRPPPSASSSRVRPPANPFVPAPSYVFALSSDGMLHTMYVSNGEDGKPAVKFLAPNANAHGLIVVDGVAYVATTNDCGGVANGVWALDLESKKVSSWKSPSGVAGVWGPAVGPEGTIYVATAETAKSAKASHSLAALKPKTLESISAYTPDQGFTSTPVVIDYKDKDLIAVTVKDGSIHLLDGTNLGGADQRTPLHKTAAYSSAGGDFVPGALAAWRDSAGVNWVLAPAAGPLAPGMKFQVTNGDVKNGAIVAWKIVEQNGAAALEPAWVSRDMLSPLPPIVVNGVVFAAASGEFRTTDRSMPAAQRAQKSTHAVLYALDGATGKVLWESGNTITSFARGGLSAGGSTVYIGTHDGTLYAFGFPIEH